MFQITGLKSIIALVKANRISKSHEILETVTFSKSKVDSSVDIWFTNLRQDLTITVPVVGEVPERLSFKISDLAAIATDDAIEIDGNAVDGNPLFLLNNEDLPIKFAEVSINSRLVASIETKAFKQALKLTTPFASSDETKQILTTIQVAQHELGLRFSSTDGHRLSDYVESAKTYEDNLRFNIPRDCFKTLDKLCAIATSAINIVLDKEFVFFDCLTKYGFVRYASRTEEGRYPDFDSLIPASCEYSLTFWNAKKLTAELTTVQKLQKDCGVVRLVPVGRELAKSNKVTYNAEFKTFILPIGDMPELNLGFALSIKYLADFLKLCTGDVKVIFDDKFGTVTAKLGNWTHLLMRVQVRD